MRDSLGIDDVVQRLLSAIRDGRWDAVRESLHPYVHWHAAGVRLRGRRKVIEMLRSSAPPAPPSSYELRDGQIYRWEAGAPE